MKIFIPPNEIDSLIPIKEVEDLIQENMSKAVANTIDVALTNIYYRNAGVLKALDNVRKLVAEQGDPDLLECVEAELLDAHTSITTLTTHFATEQAVLENESKVKH